MYAKYGEHLCKAAVAYFCLFLYIASGPIRTFQPYSHTDIPAIRQYEYYNRVSGCVRASIHCNIRTSGIQPEGHGLCKLRPPLCALWRPIPIGVSRTWTKTNSFAL